MSEAFYTVEYENGDSAETIKTARRVAESDVHDAMTTVEYYPEAKQWQDPDEVGRLEMKTVHIPTSRIIKVIEG